MAPRHNNMISNNHFHKDWQRYVKVKFNQAASKLRRRIQRHRRTAATAPRPFRPLRPIVRCPTCRYNSKIRAGYGFTLQELRAAGLNDKYARSIGITVDYRRRNKSVESLQLNVQRLKEYRSRLIVFPEQYKSKKLAEQHLGEVFAVNQRKVKQKAKAQVVTDEQKKFNAYVYLRQARSEALRVSNKLKKTMKVDNP